MKRISKLFILFISFSLVACGGGGGGGSKVASFAGVWSGVLFLVLNNCNFDVDDSIVVVHTVNQDGTRVVLDTPSGAVFSGTTDGNDGFTVGNDVLSVKEVAPGIFCDLDAAIQYKNVKGNEADVIAATRLKCTDGRSSFTCDTGYAGVVTRSS